MVPGRVKRGARGPEPGDLVHPFMIERSGIRGRLLRLGPALDTIVNRPGYPEPIARLLAELLALGATLASTLKYNGSFTLQIKGSEAVRTMVMDVTSDGGLRGYAGYDPKAVSALTEAGTALSLPAWVGSGHMAFTVDQGEFTERYQGLVALHGETILDSLLHYFRQSQQVNAGILVGVRPPEESSTGTWRAGALLIEQVPDDNATKLDRVDDEDWRRALILMSSCSEPELVEPSLAPNDLLYRLFHEEGVRVFEPRPLSVGCRCTEDRMERVLRSIAREELEELMVDDKVVLTCEFCALDFPYSSSDLDRLYGTGKEAASRTDNAAH